jgi:hypothetical protein
MSFGIVASLTSEDHERIIVSLDFGKVTIRLPLDLWWTAAMAHLPFPLNNYANAFAILVSTGGSPAPFYLICFSSNCNIAHIKLFILSFGLEIKWRVRSFLKQWPDHSIVHTLQSEWSWIMDGMRQSDAVDIRRWAQTHKLIFSIRLEKNRTKAIQLIELTFVVIARGNLQFQLLAVGSIHSFLVIKLN